jgi:hypothetical protein
MKKFVLLYVSSRRQPAPEDMEKIKKWFEILGERIVDSGNPFAAGIEIAQSETKALPQDNEEIVGYSIVNAESIDEIVKLSKDCPTKIRAYEALPM